jgi:hypothetical protein
VYGTGTAGTVYRTKSRNVLRHAGCATAWPVKREDEAARQAEAAKLVADLGYRPSTRELILIEQVAIQVVRSRKLLAKGRHEDATECTRLITRALSQLGLGARGSVSRGPFPVPPGTKTLDDIRAELAAKDPAKGIT